MFEQIKKFGFGLMHLPRLADDSIDVELVKQLVDEFLGTGFKYFDTEWAYPGSEKLAAWRATTKDEAHKQFEDSLNRTGAGYFDFYLLHNMGNYHTSYEVAKQHGKKVVVMEPVKGRYACSCPRKKKS